jgi:ABC-2 type transport system permease protein
MRRILLVAKRDYLAAIRAKAFLISLIVAPIMFSGGFIGMGLMKKNPDLKDRHVAIVDRTGVSAAAIIQAATDKYEKDRLDARTDKDTAKEPRYLFETVAPDAAHPDEQRLALSDRARKGELFAFLEVGAAAVHPAEGKEAEKDAANRVDYYVARGGIDQSKSWLTSAVTDGMRRVRLAEAGVPPGSHKEILKSANVQTMSLVSRDPATGALAPAQKKKEMEEFMVPFGMMMLLCMIVLASASPMLGAVADDKQQRVFEMLLGSATPFELMAGKILGALALAITSSVFYIGCALVALESMALMGLAPVTLLPWFVVYLIADVMVLSGLGMALGAACSSPHDAQQLAVLLLTPVLAPMFLLMPVVQHPTGTLATALSLFPPFTPILMMLRQAMPGGVPAWQPWVGLLGVLLWTVGVCWAAARIFRVVLLMQGSMPKLSQLARWAVKG